MQSSKSSITANPLAGRVQLAVSLAAVMAVLLVGSSAVAHEFWLEATDFTPKKDEHISITHFVGHDFTGESFPYRVGWFKRYVVVDSKGERDAEGVDGHDPALKLQMKNEGLTILAYHSNPNAITFKTWSDFTTYLKEEGLERFEATHRQKGKPHTEIGEFYTRYAKSLIGVAGGKGDDRPIGLPLEFVAERNPFTLQEGERLPVRLLQQGKPVPGVLIKAFNKTNPKQPFKVRTDSDGRAEIPLPRAGTYMLNAVHMMEPKGLPDNGQTYHWMSDWTSLTFARP